MATYDPESIARLLDIVDLRLGYGRRVRLLNDKVLSRATGPVALVYVVEGTAQVRAPFFVCRRRSAERDQRIAGAEDQHDALLVAGDAFLAFGQSQLVLASASNAELTVIDAEFTEATSALTAGLPRTMKVTGFDSLEPIVAGVASMMGTRNRAVFEDRTGDNAICRTMSTVVMMSVIRAWAESADARRGRSPAARDPFIDRVIEAVRHDPGHSWTVERLAAVAAMSRSVFSERFRATTGRSPAEYVTAVRIDTARRMLLDGETVSATSRTVGYSSDEGFSRAFRRLIGVTPSAWRQERPAPRPCSVTNARG